MVSREMLQRALAVIKTRADYEYFFTKLTSAAWLLPMIEEGLFANPPSLVRTGDRTAVPYWPESDYLARVASQEPDLAARALAAVPLNDNDRVHEDLTRTALQVSIDAAARWAAREAEWIKGRDYLYWRLPDALARLVVRLATENKVDEALALARVLLDVRPDPSSQRDSSDEQTEWRLPPQPTSRFDHHDYHETVAVLLVPLVRAAKLRAVELFGDLLDDAVVLSTRSEDREGSADYSSIWRNDLSGSEVGDDVRDALVEATRDAALQVIAEGESCGNVLRVIRSHNWDVMRRLDLFIITEVCAEDEELVRSRLLDDTLFNDVVVQHEYATLLQKAAVRLKDRDLQTLFGWIGAGPDVAPNPDDSVESIDRWRRDRLALLRPVLPVEWDRKLGELVDTYGPANDDFRPYRSSGAYSWSPSSPNTADELSTMPSTQLLDMLRTWEPTGDRDEPSVDGLASAIGGLSLDAIERFSVNAADWLTVNPFYIASFLSAIQRATADGRSVQWSAVLELCAGAAQSLDSTQGAMWARKAVADLLEKALRRGTGSLPLEHRREVWAILESLLNADGEQRDDQELSGGEEIDALTVALNSTRGKAAEAAVRYAIWVRLANLGEQGAGVPLTTDLPEVDSLLDRLLDPVRFRSAAIRGVFGYQLEALCWLDADWVKRHLDRLFPKEAGAEPLRQAVWLTFLRYGRPFRHALALLRAEYDFAIATVRRTPLEKGSSTSRDTDARLGEHLMSYYWRGDLSIESGGLVDQFFAAAADDLRHRALEYVGRSLRDATNIPEAVLGSLQQLWDWRMSQGGNTRPSRATPEAEAFGWWFSSGKLDDMWSLSRLAEALRIGETVEPDHFVAERLVTLVETAPLAVADCLLLMVEKTPHGYSILGWRDELTTMLDRLVSNDRSEVRSRVQTILNVLAARGIREFQRPETQW